MTREQVEELARVRFAGEYGYAASVIEREEKRGYSEHRYYADDLREAYVDGFKAAAQLFGSHEDEAAK